MLTTLIEFLRDNPDPTEQEVRIAISGNLCRCTGYQSIVAAALDAREAPAGATDARLERGTRSAQTFARLEDPRAAARHGRFVDDIHLPGMLHAAFVRSPHAHALIRAHRQDRGAGAARRARRV